jgi:3-oxoadipate enol-lactonase
MSEHIAELPDGASLWYEVAGDGPAVTFIHPGLWDARTWDREFARFAEAGFRTLRYDVRGYGRSSRPTGGPYAHHRDLVAVLDAAGIDRTALVGCSMGGGIAIDASLEHPDRVRALVVVASAAEGVDPLPEEEAWWETATAGIDEAVEAGDLDRAQDLRLGIWAPLGTQDEAGARIREIAFDNLHELTMDEEAVEELDPPAFTRLGEIAVPTLVVLGSRDVPYLERMGTLTAAGIAGAEVVSIEGADHVVNLRRPDAFEAAVLPFLQASAERA